jgi:hypothetical protein
MKKTVKSGEISRFFVRPTGFEPAASRVGVTHFTCLRYECVYEIISIFKSRIAM